VQLAKSEFQLCSLNVCDASACSCIACSVRINYVCASLAVIVAFLISMALFVCFFLDASEWVSLNFMGMVDGGGPQKDR
jgi:hypothetical protein